jgi:hypothetical protein
MSIERGFTDERAVVSVVWPRTSCKPWQRILPERGRDFGLNALILRARSAISERHAEYVPGCRLG